MIVKTIKCKQIQTKNWHEGLVFKTLINKDRFFRFLEFYKTT